MQSVAFVSPTQVRTKGIDYAKTHPCGTGPFKFVKWAPDQYITLERFDDYWQKGKPYLDQIQLFSIADQTTMESAFLSGEINVMALQIGRTMNDMTNKGYNAFAFAAGTEVLMPDNNPDSHFADIRVRQAIEYAIDKKAVCSVLGYGYMEPNNQWANRPNGYWNPDLPWLDYNPAKAKQLLADAGYPNGFKTILNSQDWYKDQTLLYQRFLKEVGIDAEIKMWDSLGYEQLSTTGWKDSLLVEDHPFGPNFAASYRSDWYPWGVRFKSAIQPEGIGDLLDAAMTTADPNTQRDLNYKILKALSDVEAVIPIYSNALGYVVSPKVHNGDWLVGSDWQAWRPDKVWIEK